jgi:hypothetical protein
MPCPTPCTVCSLNQNQITCTQCISFPGVIYNIFNGTCRSNQSSYVSLTGNSFGSLWSASERPSDPYSNCGTYRVLGGISIGIANSFFTYTVTNLPVHSTIYITFNMLLIDQSPQSTYQYGINLDNQNTTSQPIVIPAQGTNECGGAGIEYLKR